MQQVLHVRVCIKSCVVPTCSSCKVAQTQHKVDHAAGKLQDLFCYQVGSTMFDNAGRVSWVSGWSRFWFQQMDISWRAIHARWMAWQVSSVRPVPFIFTHVLNGKADMPAVTACIAQRPTQVTSYYHDAVQLAVKVTNITLTWHSWHIHVVPYEHDYGLWKQVVRVCHASWIWVQSAMANAVVHHLAEQILSPRFG